MAHVRLDATRKHLSWDNAIPPVLSVRPGDTVTFDLPDSSGNRIKPTSKDEDLNTDGDVNPLVGPVFVEGAEPGDVLCVRVGRFRHQGWGWSAIFPKCGLLHEEFPGPHLQHWTIADGRCLLHGRDDIRIPCEPFCGEMGVAPLEPGAHSTIPPGPHGGNIDIRQLTEGAEVLFPVLVAGARFSCGDCHAAQGDGEVNGTGIEAPMEVELTFGLVKGAGQRDIRFRTPPPQVIPARERSGYYATVAHGPVLKSARQAVLAMIEYLAEGYALTREEAYCLCGAAVDVRVSQIVNEHWLFASGAGSTEPERQPAYTVSAQLPLSIFPGGTRSLVQQRT